MVPSETSVVIFVKIEIKLHVFVNLKMNYPYYHDKSRFFFVCLVEISLNSWNSSVISSCSLSVEKKENLIYKRSSELRTVKPRYNEEPRDWKNAHSLHRGVTVLKQENQDWTELELLRYQCSAFFTELSILEQLRWSFTC